MAIANYFYNKTTRKYVALFGTYFNQLTIERTGPAGEDIQSMIVPITYAPVQKMLARIKQDPEFAKKSALQMPRMSFEMTGLSYDPERKTPPVGRIRKSTVADDISDQNFMYAGTPYIIEFSLYIMSKYTEDSAKILEQILPFFNPDFTSSVRLIDGIDPFDVPLILNGVSIEDVYEGTFEERQTHLSTLNFTMKGWFFGPERNKKVIKFVEVAMTTGDDNGANTAFELTQTTQPGMTANNEPTTDINETIDYTLIDFDDNWDFIKVITE